MTGYTRITKAQFYSYGGFAAYPRLVRVTRDGDWAYYQENRR